MKNGMSVALPVIATVLLGLGTFSCNSTKPAGDNTSADASTKTQPATQPQSNLDTQRQQAEQQARPGVEKERKKAEDEAGRNLDQDAMAAISETQKAIDAIASNKSDQALAAIERATGKINVLLARSPATAIIPVSVNVDIIDAAPHDVKLIKDLGQHASTAVAAKDYPAARVLLAALTSEIRVRTYNLPLATYPEALKAAARLLDQKKQQDASDVLLTALNTLLVVDRVTPLPLVIAREAINSAKAQSQNDKQVAQTLVQTAKNEVERAKKLGYAPQAPEYEDLRADISNLEKQLKGNSDAGSLFAKLEDKLSAFMKRQSQQERR
jgi:YfdX protein